MKKYLRLICDTCNRTVDKLVDNSRALPDRCVITLNCQGRLFPVEYRSNAQITTAAEVGVTDWYPRGQVPVPGTSPQEPAKIDTSTGDYQQLVVGLKLAAEPPPEATATLYLAVLDGAPKDYKQYVYQRDTSFTTISGIEDGLEKKMLKFAAYGTDPDLVEVYVNGAKIEQGTAPDQFQVDNGSDTSPAAPNTVLFNTIVSPSGVWQVDVIISKVKATNQVALVMHRNRDDPVRLPHGAWENVSYLSRFANGVWDNFYLFTYDVLRNTGLRKDTILYPVNSVLVSGVGQVSLADGFISIARKPYTQLDRYPDISAILNTFGQDRDFMKYHEVEDELRLEMTETSLTTFYPPSRLTKFNPEPTIKVPTPGEGEQVVIDGQVIVGPDA